MFIKIDAEVAGRVADAAATLTPYGRTANRQRWTDPQKEWLMQQRDIILSIGSPTQVSITSRQKLGWRTLCDEIKATFGCERSANSLYVTSQNLRAEQVKRAASEQKKEGGD